MQTMPMTLCAIEEAGLDHFGVLAWIVGPCFNHIPFVVQAVAGVIALYHRK